MNPVQFVTILKARWKIAFAVLATTVMTTLVISLLISKTYSAESELIVDFKSPDLFGNGSLPIQMSSSYMATQVDVLRSHRVALKVVDALKLTQSEVVKTQFADATKGRGSIRDWLADLLVEKLKVEPSRDSRIVTLRFSSTDPQFSAAVTNAFAQAYIETNLELSIDPAKRGSDWFDSKLKNLRAGAEEAQAKITNYQQTHGIVAADERLDTENAKLTALSGELVSLQAQLADVETRESQAKRIMNQGFAESESIPEVLSNGFIQGVKAELVRQQTKLDELSRQYGENHPQYQSAQAEIQSLQRKLRKEIETLTEGLFNSARLAREKHVKLTRAVADQKQRVLKLKLQRDELNVLLREADTAQRVYDASLQRYNQMSLESQVTQTNVTVLTEAVEPTEASFPKPMLNTFLAIILGSALAIAAAMFFEFLDRRVRTEQELVDSLGLPILGVVLSDRESTNVSNTLIETFKRRLGVMKFKHAAASAN